DATSDLVLLRLDSGIPAAASAERPPRTGDTVWIVGASRPGTRSQWMSTGVASSSASSGGALVDPAGNVAGLILSPVGDSRMTYAVPIDTALSIADDL